MKSKKLVGAIALAAATFLSSGTASAAKFAVWLDGSLSSGGNGTFSSLINAFGAGSATLVTTAQLETVGFLNSFDALVVSRAGAGFGTFFTPLAAANVITYVGAPGPSQGGVALFTNDAADNLFGAATGDPFDANIDRLFINAATFASASHHGYIGEFNGAVMGVSSNSAGAPALGLLQGVASAVGSAGVSQFFYGVGPIGAGNPIDAGVTFPFTDADSSTFLTRITGANSGNIVDIYTNPSLNGLPAVLANQFVISGGPGGNVVPEPESLALFGLGAAALAMRRRRKSM